MTDVWRLDGLTEGVGCSTVTEDALAHEGEEKLRAAITTHKKSDFSVLRLLGSTFFGYFDTEGLGMNL